MSSNISIVKICEFCKNEFIAKKTTTKTCSDDCAKRLYKLKQRSSKIAQAELKTEIKRKPQATDKVGAIMAIPSSFQIIHQLISFNNQKAICMFSILRKRAGMV